jgi:assimilatory nitrate reductase catalytic subunit
MRDTLEPVPPSKSARTTCPYCGVGCGIIATCTPDGAVTVAGDPEHPANFGRLCSKGTALAETLSLDDRLLNPMINGVNASWDVALDLVAAKFTATIAEHGPDSVAFYVSGQLLTEDYYVANKLMKGFIGSANIDTNSRLCMASSVAGHKRAFGSDTVPGNYEDLDQADLVVLVGSNLAWCHPVLYQRLAAARDKRGTRIIVIDPRRTATCEIADQHLALASGSDVALFNGLLRHLMTTKAIDTAYIAAHTNDFDVAVATAQPFTSAHVANLTGLTEIDITSFYANFSKTQRAVTIYSQGVNQSAAGTDKVNAMINCHLATGRIGKAGMGPFSVTGQPNAMGGREVGGLANMLAAHMELANADHRDLVQQFWKSPRIACAQGLKAVDMFQAVGDGRIKALWIMATNPVDSMPDANAVRAAIKGCPFVVVSDVARHTDTTALAHVLLPATAWGEKNGTVTNSERRISRQRAFLEPPANARPDWWQLAEVGRRMGFAEAFAYKAPVEIYAEHAQLSAVGNNGSRDFDIGVHNTISAADYETLVPYQWPRASGAKTSTSRMFANGGFFTSDKRAKFIATPFRAPATAASPMYPLILNTGRIRDQWHTMTRTAKAPRLLSHRGEPYVEIHPTDARQLGLQAASLATVTSPYGSVVVRTLITDRQQRGTVFAPLHWTDQLASNARVDALVAPHTDPVSGQPELKHTAVNIAPYAARWYGFAVTAEEPAVAWAGYWAKARTKHGWRVELAGDVEPEDWSQAVHALTSNSDNATLDVLAYHDSASGQHRAAVFDGDRLVAALFTARQPIAASRDYLASQLGTTFADGNARLRILAGRAPADVKDNGPIVCACFSIGRNQITDAVMLTGCTTVEAVGAATSAGTNCGSCRPEIGALIHAARVAKAS